MRKVILALFVSTMALAQSGLVKPEEVAQNKPADQSLAEHYANVYKMATSLNDVDQQINALMNVYAIGQKDESLLGLSELYLNKKNYRAAFMCVNSVKDSTTSPVKNMKAWVFKLGGDVKKSNTYFSDLLKNDKDNVNQNAFQIAVNNFEMNKIAEAKKLITDYKAKTKADEIVNTTDRVAFYNAKLTAAWENLEGLILITENQELPKLKAQKDKIIAFFDKAISLDPKFAMPKDNKESFEKLIGDKK